ncbi:MAG: hypothetical protein PF445_12450 [Melioribacteraceae bacterium]|jgi:hypothetical protein|nr:hypothetical protein [Melioribacteraceae bacterium]
MAKGQFLDDTEQARRSSVAKLLFIFQCKEKLSQRRNGNKHLEAMENISKTPNHVFSSSQMAYIDDVYEMVMGQLGLPSYKGQKSKYGVNLNA